MQRRRTGVRTWRVTIEIAGADRLDLNKRLLDLLTAFVAKLRPGAQLGLAVGTRKLFLFSATLIAELRSGLE